jgi:hypothetical protein
MGQVRVPTPHAVCIKRFFMQLQQPAAAPALNAVHAHQSVNATAQHDANFVSGSYMYMLPKPVLVCQAVCRGGEDTVCLQPAAGSWHRL